MRDVLLLDPLSFKLSALLASAASGSVAIGSADMGVALLGVPLSAVFASVAGAALALSLLPPMRALQMAGSVALGAGIGIYLPPILVSQWPALASLLGPMAFFCGLGGKLAATLVFEDGRALLVGWLRSKFGGGA